MFRTLAFADFRTPYCKGGVTYTGIPVWFSYATKFLTFGQTYEKYEIKSRRKISAITKCDFSTCDAVLKDHPIFPTFSWTKPGDVVNARFVSSCKKKNEAQTPHVTSE